MEYIASNGIIYTIGAQENNPYWVERYGAPKIFFTYSFSDACANFPNRRLCKQTNQLSMCLVTSVEGIIEEIEREISQENVDSSELTESPIHYSATGQALAMLNRQTPEQHEQWNAIETEKIRRNAEAAKRADNRRRGIANDGPTYENGIQEWDD